MRVAHAALALLALANPTTPRPALWNASLDTCPDPIPRARDARATPEPPAHSVLAITLLHIGCSCTHRSLHTTETRTRLSDPHAAARQTSSLVWKDTREPAFMMLGRTPPDHQPCIYNAGHRYLSTEHPIMGNSHAPEGENTLRDALATTERAERGAPRSDTVHTLDTSTIYTMLACLCCLASDVPAAGPLRSVACEASAPRLCGWVARAPMLRPLFLLAPIAQVPL